MALAVNRLWLPRCLGSCLDHRGLLQGNRVSAIARVKGLSIACSALTGSHMHSLAGEFRLAIAMKRCEIFIPPSPADTVKDPIVELGYISIPCSHPHSVRACNLQTTSTS